MEVGGGQERGNSDDREKRIIIIMERKVNEKWRETGSNT
jgi:hypothetical protein